MKYWHTLFFFKFSINHHTIVDCFTETRGLEDVKRSEYSIYICIYMYVTVCKNLFSDVLYYNYFVLIVSRVPNVFCLVRRKRENRAQRQFQPFRQVYASVFRQQMDDQRMHNSRLSARTVKNYVSECRRTELPRVLSARRRRKGKSHYTTVVVKICCWNFRPTQYARGRIIRRRRCVPKFYSL